MSCKPSPTRKTPRVQFANISKKSCVKISNAVYRAVSQPTCSTSCPVVKFGSFSNMRKRVNKDKMWTVLSPNIQFLWLLQYICLLWHLNHWCGFCWQSICRHLWPEFVYISFCYIEKLDMESLTKLSLLKFHLNFTYFESMWRQVTTNKAEDSNCSYHSLLSTMLLTAVLCFIKFSGYMPHALFFTVRWGSKNRAKT